MTYRVDMPEFCWCMWEVIKAPTAWQLLRVVTSWVMVSHPSTSICHKLANMVALVTVGLTTRSDPITAQWHQAHNHSWILEVVSPSHYLTRMLISNGSKPDIKISCAMHNFIHRHSNRISSKCKDMVLNKKKDKIKISVQIVQMLYLQMGYKWIGSTSDLKW